jgi:hypothetical protein
VIAFRLHGLTRAGADPARFRLRFSFVCLHPLTHTFSWQAEKAQQKIQAAKEATQAKEAKGALILSCHVVCVVRRLFVVAPDCSDRLDRVS